MPRRALALGASALGQSAGAFSNAVMGLEDRRLRRDEGAFDRDLAGRRVDALEYGNELDETRQDETRDYRIAESEAQRISENRGFAKTFGPNVFKPEDLDLPPGTDMAALHRTFREGLSGKPSAPGRYRGVTISPDFEPGLGQVEQVHSVTGSGGDPERLRTPTFQQAFGATGGYDYEHQTDPGDPTTYTEPTYETRNRLSMQERIELARAESSGREPPWPEFNPAGARLYQPGTEEHTAAVATGPPEPGAFGRGAGVLAETPSPAEPLPGPAGLAADTTPTPLADVDDRDVEAARDTIAKYGLTREDVEASGIYSPDMLDKIFAR